MENDFAEGVGDNAMGNDVAEENATERKLVRREEYCEYNAAKNDATGHDATRNTVEGTRTNV